MLAHSTEVAPERRRRGVLPALFALLALLALIAGVVFGTGWFKGQHFGQTVSVTATAKPIVTATHTTPVVTATTLTTPQPSATADTTSQAATPQSTIPPVYPVLGKLYNGQVTNTFVTPNESAPMELRNIVQSGGNITSGYFYVAPGHDLQGSGNFTGIVSTNKTIQFTVQETGILPLLFTGTIGADGSMSGIYYASNPDNSRNYTQGHGTWFTNPPSS